MNDNTNTVEGGNEKLLGHTSQIVAAFVSNNAIEATAISNIIALTYSALSGLATGPAIEPERAPQEPAVSIRASIKPDYLVCLEDGKKVKMLKRYLRTHFDLSPEDYRRKWGLPSDYPMVAPNYSDKRRTLAKSIGLGTKRRGTAAVEADDSAPKAAAKKPSKKVSAKVEEPKVEAEQQTVEA